MCAGSIGHQMSKDDWFCMSEEFKPADYSFVVKRRANPPKPWRWEIYRACTSVPVERSPVFFESMTAATKEGKKALAQLLAKAQRWA